jgi:hypothetical protein
MGSLIAMPLLARHGGVSRLLRSILFHGAFAPVLVVGQSGVKIVSRFSHGVSSPGQELHAARFDQSIAKLLPSGRVNPVDLRK